MDVVYRIFLLRDRRTHGYFASKGLAEWKMYIKMMKVKCRKGATFDMGGVDPTSDPCFECKQLVEWQWM